MIITLTFVEIFVAILVFTIYTIIILYIGFIEGYKIKDRDK